MPDTAAATETIRAERTRGIPVVTNAVLAGGHLGAVAIVYFGLPFLLPLGDWWALAALAATAVGLATPAYWAVVHEAFHGALLTDHRWNDRLGRVLCLFFGAPYRSLRFGHLQHHRLNRTAFDRAEVYEPGRSGTRFGHALAYFFRLTVGLYVAELLSNLIAFLPKRILRPVVNRIYEVDAAERADMRARVEKALLAGPALAEIRCDAAVILVLHAGAFWLYGEHWWVLAMLLVVRGVLISVFDNAPHYGTPLNVRRGGRDQRFLFGWSCLILHFNLHGTHHRHPNLPWTALPAAFRAEGGSYDGSFAGNALNQFRGPVPIAAVRGESRVGAAAP